MNLELEMMQAKLSREQRKMLRQLQTSYNRAEDPARHERIAKAEVRRKRRNQKRKDQWAASSSSSS